MLTIAEESPIQREVSELMKQSDAYSNARYPPESQHMSTPEALAEPNARFLVARIGGRAVGCGALVIGAGGQAEIKRMIVDVATRGQGIGRAILGALENVAHREHVVLMQLETGIYNTEALSLYRRFGFREREPFGSYRPDPLSVFMEKIPD